MGDREEVRIGRGQGLVIKGQQEDLGFYLKEVGALKVCVQRTGLDHGAHRCPLVATSGTTGHGCWGEGGSWGTSMEMTTLVQVGDNGVD